MEPRVNLVKNLTKLAGEKLLDYYKQEQAVTEKSAIDFALEADTTIENFILEAIRKSFPEDSILAEETGEQANSSEYLWIVDPLDGTANFKAQIPYFCSTIALQHNDQLVAAAVYDPINKHLYFAEKNAGAYLNGNRIHVSDTTILRKFLISYSTSNHKNQDVVNKGSTLFHILLTECRAIRLQGSSILDLCGLASGVFDGLVKVGANYWDFAAGCLIVEEAGGQVTGLDGTAWSRKSENILASNGSLHAELLAKLNSSLRY